MLKICHLRSLSVESRTPLCIAAFTFSGVSLITLSWEPKKAKNASVVDVISSRPTVIPLGVTSSHTAVRTILVSSGCWKYVVPIAAANFSVAVEIAVPRSSEPAAIIALAPAPTPPPPADAPAADEAFNPDAPAPGPLLLPPPPPPLPAWISSSSWPSSRICDPSRPSPLGRRRPRRASNASSSVFAAAAAGAAAVDADDDDDDLDVEDDAAPAMSSPAFSLRQRLMRRRWREKSSDLSSFQYVMGRGMAQGPVSPVTSSSMLRQMRSASRDLLSVCDFSSWRRVVSMRMCDSRSSAISPSFRFSVALSSLRALVSDSTHSFMKRTRSAMMRGSNDASSLPMSRAGRWMYVATELSQFGWSSWFTRSGSGYDSRKNSGGVASSDLRLSSRMMPARNGRNFIRMRRMSLASGTAAPSIMCIMPWLAWESAAPPAPPSPRLVTALRCKLTFPLRVPAPDCCG
eukprot:comp22516_c0_seq1/m.56489 comp22516_c0_seq1/g.56489  ORF comp22516_c0_seq1/g.56489 comp22516_c0_seq1/m.56489 type:complete len:460 (+) comp22516_c0_seq1:1704-3083(+)